MAKYKSIVITNTGLSLVAAAHSGDTINFTAIKTGNGIYDGTEVLEDMTDLKSVQQTFGISGLTREATVVKVRSVLSNEGLTNGYYMTEIGVYAIDPNTSNEILYAFIIAEDDMSDYFSPYEDSPQNITLEVYIEAAGLVEGVTFTASIVPGTYATAQDLEDYRVEIMGELEETNANMEKVEKNFEEHIGNKDNPHNITKETVGLEKVPNVSTNDQTPTYTEATEISELTSGEKISTAFGKIAKAVKKLISHIGDFANPHKVTKSQIGLANVENKSSETIRNEITSQNVTRALGYTPINSTLKGSNNGLAELDANGKVPTSQLPSYVDDVLEYSSKSAFPTTGESGKIYIATDTNLQYRWSGTAYVEISSSLALGETPSTAYRGDRGAVAYTHSQKTSGNPHGVTKNDVGLGNVTNEKQYCASNPQPSVTGSSGSCTGNSATASKWENPISLSANLSANNQSTLVDGSKDIAIAIKGTLPITNGGTGGTNADEARSRLGLDNVLFSYLFDEPNVSNFVYTVTIPNISEYAILFINAYGPSFGGVVILKYNGYSCMNGLDASYGSVASISISNGVVTITGKQQAFGCILHSDKVTIKRTVS